MVPPLPLELAVDAGSDQGSGLSFFGDYPDDVHFNFLDGWGVLQAVLEVVELRERFHLAPDPVILSNRVVTSIPDLRRLLHHPLMQYLQLPLCILQLHLILRLLQILLYPLTIRMKLLKYFLKIRYRANVAFQCWHQAALDEHESSLYLRNLIHLIHSQYL